MVFNSLTSYCLAHSSTLWHFSVHLQRQGALLQSKPEIRGRSTEVLVCNTERLACRAEILAGQPFFPHASLRKPCLSLDPGTTDWLNLELLVVCSQEHCKQLRIVPNPFEIHTPSVQQVAVYDKRPRPTDTLDALKQSWPILLSKGGSMALQAAGLDPGADCKTAASKYIYIQSKTREKPVFSPAPIGGRMTCRPTLLTSIIEYCIKQYPRTEWFFEE